MKVYAVKTKDGYFISTSPLNNYSTERESLRNKLIDGKAPSDTFHKNWVFVDHEPVKISHMVRQPRINHRYELIDKTLACDRFPAVMKREDVAVYDDGEWSWKEEFSPLRSLYVEVSDEQPDTETDDPFEWVVVASVDSITEPDKMGYVVAGGRWASDGKDLIANNTVEHQVFDSIVFPSILLHERPSRLSSRDSYRIIREHVQNNIDPRAAKITSDYDFCFTVQKRVPKAKPYHYTVDVNNSIFDKRKRKPKYVEKIQSEIFLPCFEMTWSPENYKGYTPMPPFEADNETALNQYIDQYLSHLMAVINEPLTECHACCGVGYLKSVKES